MRKHRSASYETKIPIIVMVGETVSIAAIAVGAEPTVLGEAKRASGDVWSPEVGRDIATGRALVNAGQALLEKHGVGR